nr:hypothetical protein [Tanacetum cinerariifolium]
MAAAAAVITTTITTSMAASPRQPSPRLHHQRHQSPPPCLGYPTPQPPTTSKAQGAFGFVGLEAIRVFGLEENAQGCVWYKKMYMGVFG